MITQLTTPLPPRPSFTAVPEDVPHQGGACQEAQAEPADPVLVPPEDGHQDPLQQEPSVEAGVRVRAFRVKASPFAAAPPYDRSLGVDCKRERIDNFHNHAVPEDVPHQGGACQEAQAEPADPVLVPPEDGHQDPLQQEPSPLAPF
eukprot:CAMPEP_0118888302 /NCGR_PEP_ID=MMETSP1163-20130328/25651_1 /TAXON_ID=124430 /ORGANISM="Phaeomonas parva, Strain CCMP2877" /LENGTH=145 /DNA_ID=CAMNT_0006826865 /DNA_START=263 /DNA_END=700 /DNA_ORIENTATION=+